MLDKTWVKKVLVVDPGDTNAGPLQWHHITLLSSSDPEDLTIKTRFMKTSINEIYERLLGYLRQLGVS